MRALSNPPFGNYRVWWSLADSKYAGTALFVKKCFKPKSVVFNLDKIGILCFTDFVIAFMALDVLFLYI
jgi:aminoglycoside/choline kinase family phosphotransferase